MTSGQGIAVLAVVAAVLLVAMRVGWVHRAARTAAVVPEPPAVPKDPGTTRCGPIEATYVSTTLAGSWMDRVAAHGLGTRSAATVAVHDAGVVVTRQGAPDLFVPVGALQGADLEPGIAGKVVGGRRVVVVRWVVGSATLDTGLLPRRSADRQILMETLAELVPAAGTQPAGHAPPPNKEPE